MSRNNDKENEVREAMWLAQEYGLEILKAAADYAARQRKKRKG